jgi:O-antigen/teichoic acid export membrane protein
VRPKTQSEPTVRSRGAGPFLRHAWGRRGAARRISWSIVDQALSSLTNAALAIVVARSVDAEGFGAFALAFTLYSFFLAVSRSFISDPLTIRYSDAASHDFRTARRAAAGAAVWLGTLTGALLVLVALTQTGSLRSCLFALGITLPALAVQDVVRVSFISEGNPRKAALNDLLWGVLLVSALALLLIQGVSSPALLLGGWGVTSGVAVLFGVRQGSGWPAFVKALPWMLRHRDLSRLLVAEHLAALGALQVALVLVGAIAGITAVGALRGAAVLLSPLFILGTSVVFFAVPELVRRKDSQTAQLRAAVVSSAALSLVTVLWVGSMLLIPDDVGRQILGDAWGGARDVLPAMSLAQLALGVAIGPMLTLRAFGAARETLLLALVLAPGLLAFGVIGVALWGAEGAAAGFALAQWVQVPFIWLQMRAVLRRQFGSPNAAATAT